MKLFRREPLNIPVMRPLPGNGCEYVWPCDRVLFGNVVKAGARFYCQGDTLPRGSAVRNPVFQFTRKRRWWEVL
jgi:hypothetical protein